MKAFLCCILTSFCCFNLTAEQISEPELWPVLYQGHWSLGHKMILNRKISSTNDEILSQIMMAYLKYKSGDQKAAIQLFQEIDQYVEHYYIQD